MKRIHDIPAGQPHHLLEYIRNSLIGDDQVMEGPYGARRLTYGDYTASGRSLSFIEDFIRGEVMPFYANTHTESSGTGRQTTRFREEAREIVRRGVGAGEEDAVIFCGSGATGAIDKLIDILDLRIAPGLDRRYGLSAHIPAEERPVVFVGPYEHHSNELPWRESVADLLEIEENPQGGIDLEHLERALLEYAGRPLKIGSFSAASNVTGIISDCRAVAELLHRHGALSFWDYAAAAPYVPIGMSGSPNGGDYLDAVFISPHKFVGGPGSPGVLVVKRALLTNKVPTVPGGGTVAYVSPTDHHYISDPEHREEGGTPEILGAIRAGLVFQLKEAVGCETILSREHDFTHRALSKWGEHPNLRILGNTDANRLSIVSFLIRHGPGYLHHEFVVALLNDLFGIQSRSGCSCAGPYGHRLLGIDADTSKAFEDAIVKGCEGVKPGWVRLGFNYFISETVFEFMVRAVEWVAESGWKLLPDYRFDPETGRWTHWRADQFIPMRLAEISYRDRMPFFPTHRSSAPESVLETYLEEAGRRIGEGSPGPPEAAMEEALLPRAFAHLRWFPLPGEISAELRGEKDAVRIPTQLPMR